MKNYRKTKGSDRWHWCINCKNYPKTNYEEKIQDDFPYPGELCVHCKNLEKSRKCNLK